MSANWLDPVAAWKRLDPRVQEQLGAAAIAFGIGNIGVATAEDVGRWDAASTEAGLLIDALAQLHVLLRNGMPDGVDLKPLGIQQCRECGCTDNCACEDDCFWAEPGLCSACKEKDEAAVGFRIEGGV